MMPPNGHKEISLQMKQVIEEKVDDVIWEIHNRRRSDSNELPSFTKTTDVETERPAVEENMVHFQ
jgi:hypothetical protein